MAAGDTGKISPGGRMDFSGGRFDTLPFLFAPVFCSIKFVPPQAVKSTDFWCIVEIDWHCLVFAAFGRY